MFSGVLCLADDKRPGEFLEHPRLLDILSLGRQPDGKGVWQDERFLLTQTLTFNTAESRHETVPWHCPESGLVIAAWCRLDERADLARQLAIDGAALAALTDPMLILAAYRRWGDRCPEHLVGDFAFAIYDPRRRSLFAARDRVGAKPFYYLLANDAFVFATTAAVFPALLRQRPGPDRQWMALFLVDRSMSFTKTAFAGVLKLPPAHALSLDEGGLRQRRYFDFVDDAPAVYRRSQHWVDAYREAIEEAVRCRLRSDYPIASESSGGLDSSAVTALAARLLPQPLTNLLALGSVSFEQEVALALATSYASAIRDSVVLTAPASWAEDVDRGLAVTGYPVENSVATYYEGFYQWAVRFGARTLLSGFGGDEAVTFPGGGYLRRELRRAGQCRALWQIVPGRRLVRPLRFLKWLLLPEHMPSWQEVLQGQWAGHFLRQDVVARHALDQAYLSFSARDDEFGSINECILGDRLGAHIPSRLESCNLLAHSHGVDYRWPLLDHRLIQQCLSTPSVDKAGREFDRLLHRRAMDGVVASAVNWKRDKDMGAIHPTHGAGIPPYVLQWMAVLQAGRDGPLADFVDFTCLQQRFDRYRAGEGDVRWRLVFELNVRQAYWLDRWLRRYFP